MIYHGVRGRSDGTGSHFVESMLIGKVCIGRYDDLGVRGRSHGTSPDLVVVLVSRQGRFRQVC
jgi:hypothetical protein